MEKTRILVTVKTTPLLSTHHIETVCTAGLLPDGRWIRIYPIPYRLLDKSQQFHKYQWISVRRSVHWRAFWGKVSSKN